jgi:peptidoglycan hydrolase CwlO-like protein
MVAKKTTLDALARMISKASASADNKFAALAEDLARWDKRIDRLDAKIESVESNLAGKINRLDTKLTKFEEHEIDKRLQLEVRVTAIEKHLGLDKKIAA